MPTESAAPDLGAATPAQDQARAAHAEGCRLRELADGHRAEADRLHALADAAFRRAVAALTGTHDR
jgi:hypothetical protein